MFIPKEKQKSRQDVQILIAKKVKRIFGKNGGTKILHAPNAVSVRTQMYNHGT